MKINQDSVPSTLNEAINSIVDTLDQKDKDFIKQNEPSSVHFTIGMYLRNNWDLWEKDSPLVLDVKQRFGLWGHGDDVSGLILEGVWAKVNGIDVDKILVQRSLQCKHHWEKAGVNWKTGEEKA